IDRARDEHVAEYLDSAIAVAGFDQDLRRQRDALVADRDVGTGDELSHLALGAAAERARRWRGRLAEPAHFTETGFESARISTTCSSANGGGFATSSSAPAARAWSRSLAFDTSATVGTGGSTCFAARSVDSAPSTSKSTSTTARSISFVISVPATEASAACRISAVVMIDLIDRASVVRSWRSPDSSRICMP